MSAPKACEALEGRTLLSVGPPALVADINTTTAPSNPSWMVRLNDRILFRADDGYHGSEWFATDGSAAGTRLLRDISAGPTGSAPFVESGKELPMAVAGGKLFFAAKGGSNGLELWKTDGTPGGTSLVKDIRVGPVDSSPDYFVAVGNLVYFTADDGTSGRELWKSDGTAAGTVRVADLVPGTGSGAPIPLAAVGGKLLMAGRQVDPTTPIGDELWVSDGTAGGTVLLKNIHTRGSGMPGIERLVPPGGGTGTSYVRQVVTTADGKVYFPANSLETGRELWRTDGTAEGTVLVADLVPTTTTLTGPSNLVAVGNTVYFVAPTTVQGSPSVVYRTDPASPAGAEAIDTLAGVGDGAPVLGAAGGRLYMVGAVREPGSLPIVGLFTHDPASPAGTKLTLLRETNKYLPLSRPLLGDGTDYIADFNGEAYVLNFEAVSGNSVIELIRSDGTPQGTTQVFRSPYPFNVAGPVEPATWVAPWRAVAGPNGVYFAAEDPATGVEPWRSDGTAGGTARIADVNVVTLRGVSAAPVVELNGRGLFYATQPGLGTELWSTDGTAGGTRLLKDVYRGPSTSLWSVAEMERYNGRVYFRADDGVHGIELWSTDGTPGGTSLLKDIHPTGSSIPKELTVFGGRLFFIAADPVHGDRLWSTDGTAEGTVMLADAPGSPLPGYSDVFTPTVAGDTLYFIADHPRTGLELWKTDGTPEGTSLVRDLSLTTGEWIDDDGIVYPWAMQAVGDTLYFTSGSELYRSDGTFAGTTRVTGLPGTAWDLMAVNGRLLFRAPLVAGGTDHAVWASDGTEAGTAPLQGFTPDGTSVSARDPAGALAWFFDKPDSMTWRMWRTDGTQQGTAVVKTLPVGEGSQTSGYIPQVLGFAEGLMYLRAPGPAGGELWRSDGTADGTVLVADIYPGPVASSPAGFGVAGGRAYFTADDGRHGMELWSIPLEPVVAGRYVFYNNSAFDGRRAAADAGDDAAVAPDKRPLLPGFDASGVNVSGSSRGLNGVMVDVAGLPAGADVAADDFAFRWRPAGASDWSAAPAPRSVAVRRGAGSSGSDRITLTWDDATLADGWLEVTIKATDDTGLSRPDTFVFGNLRGDTGNDAGTVRVSAADLARTRAALGSRATPSSPFDHNRDGRVDTLDLAVVRRGLFNTLPPVEWAPPGAEVASARSLKRRAAYGVL